MLPAARAWLSRHRLEFHAGRVGPPIRSAGRGPQRSLRQHLLADLHPVGLGATAAGSFLFDNQPLLNQFAGVAIIAMGLLFLASVFVPQLAKEWRPTGLIDRPGRGGPIVAGAAFAIAWTPCVGPTLGAILGLASTTDGTGKGAILLGVYSAGLALPFMFAAIAFDSASRAFAIFKRHYAAIQVTAGIVMIAMGVLVLTGDLFLINIEVQQFLDRYGLNFFQSV